MKLFIKKGTTSKLVRVFIQDYSVTTGAGLTGLTSGSSGLTAYYCREGANAATSISLSGGTLGTWSSGGFIAVDGTNMPGLYEIGIPDAAIASGANSVVIMLKGATNMAPVLLEIELVAFDEQDSVRMGLTALPNATPGAAGGLFIAGANAATSITTALTANIIGNITGNLSGSVGSVTAAVTISAAAVQAIWDALTSALTTVGSIGKRLADDIDATISSRSTLDAAGVWAAGTRTLTSFGTLVADVTTAVWAAGTRTLTSFGTLVADVTTAVWAAASRTLTAFGFTVDTNANATETAIKAKTDLIPAAGPASAADYTSGRAAKLDFLDVAISTRLATAGYTAPDNAGIATISGNVSALVTDVNSIQSDVTSIKAKTDELTFTVPNHVDATATVDVSGVAQAVWTYSGPRTLTMTTTQIQAIVVDHRVTVYRGDEWTVSLTGLGSLVGRTKLWVTLKNDVNQTDVDATVQIIEEDGLVRLDGEDPAELEPPLADTDGEVVVDDETLGNITITLLGAAAKLVEPQTLMYDVQYLDAGGQPHTIVIDLWDVLGDVTREVS